MTKELEALEEIGNYRISEIDYCVKDTNDYAIVETALKEYERMTYLCNGCIQHSQTYYIEKKALEIIKEKDWLVEEILDAFFEDRDRYDLLKELLL